MNAINFEDPNLCLHVIDYMSPSVNTVEIIGKLELILQNGLLTAESQGRRKNGEAISSDDTIDVWSPLLHGQRGEDPKSQLSQIAKDVGTSVNLLLSAEHEEFGPYPHSITGAIPKVVGLVLATKYQSLWWNKEFLAGLQALAKQYQIPVLTQDLEVFNFDIYLD